jgi:hypothetical protein
MAGQLTVGLYPVIMSFGVSVNFGLCYAVQIIGSGFPAAPWEFGIHTALESFGCILSAGLGVHATFTLITAVRGMLAEKRPADHAVGGSRSATAPGIPGP